MELEHLDQDEILVELEVRGLVKPGVKDVTEALRQSLLEKFKNESQHFIKKPRKAHEAALKQPQREARDCSGKLVALQKEVAEEKTVKDLVPRKLAKLQHIDGRMVRTIASATFYKLTMNLRENFDVFKDHTVEMFEEEINMVQFVASVTKLDFEVPNLAGLQ